MVNLGKFRLEDLFEKNPAKIRYHCMSLASLTSVCLDFYIFFLEMRPSGLLLAAFATHSCARKKKEIKSGISDSEGHRRHRENRLSLERQPQRPDRFTFDVILVI